VSSFSALWRLEKAISANSLNKRLKGTYFRVSSFSAFWGHENSIFFESCNPLFKGTSLSLNRFSSFLGPENATFPRRETHGSREHSFLWVHFLHFGVLKMRFLRSWNTWYNFWRVIKPTVHGYMAFSNSFSAFLKPDNFYFWRIMKPTIQRNVLPFSSFYAFWRPHFLHL